MKEFHILGLGVDETDVQFLKKLEQYGALRQERNEKMTVLISEKRLNIDQGRILCSVLTDL